MRKSSIITLTALLVAIVPVASTNAQPHKAPNGSSYEVPVMVNAIVNDRLRKISGEPDQFDAAAHHLIGFMLIYDSKCDFLPTDTFDRTKAFYIGALDASKAAGANKQDKFRADAAMAGARDAITFHNENGCASKKAKRAVATLKTVGNLAEEFRRKATK